MKCDRDDADRIGLDEHFAPMKDESLILEKRLEQWKEKLFEFRQKNPLMNYFTVKQCLVLQKHLYALSKNMAKANMLPPQVVTLLKCITDDISVRKIKDAFCFSSFLDDDNNNANDWKKAKSDQPTNFTELSLHELQDYVDMIQDEHSIDENVALASLMVCFPLAVGKAILWCKKQNPDSDLIDSMASEAEKELKKLEELSKHEVVETKENENDEIVAPFLSLQHFGLFLEEVYKMTGILFPK